MNTVTLVGRLDTEPVLRLVGKQSVVRIRLAVDGRAEQAPTLVDVDVVRFLNSCEAERVRLVDCSPYIRQWMRREHNRSQGLAGTRN